jgi:adenylylsulfate kinase-like enzyme
MPRIVNIHGLMAAGKSTIVDILNKKLKTYSYIDRAYIKKQLRPAGKQNARKVSKKATYLLIKELMKLRKNILIQEVNPRDLKRKLRYYFSKYGYNMKSFYVHCSLETALVRDEQRSKKTRPVLVKRIHARYKGQEKQDVAVNTEKLSVRKSVNLILKELKKK